MSRHQLKFAFTDGVLLFEDRIAVPANLRAKVLEWENRSHKGMTSMKRRIRGQMWWPQMDESVERTVRACMLCQMIATPKSPIPLMRTPLPQEVWTDLALDIMGPFHDGSNILVLVDYIRRVYEVRILINIATKDVMEALEDIFLS